jgi:hypothetical protein
MTMQSLSKSEPCSYPQDIKIHLVIVSRNVDEWKRNEKDRELEESVWMFKKLIFRKDNGQRSVLEVAQEVAQVIIKKHENDDSLCEIIGISTVGEVGQGLSSRLAASNGAAMLDSAPPDSAPPDWEEMTTFQKNHWRKNSVKRQVAATDFNEAGLSDGEDELIHCFSFISCETSDNIKRLLKIVSMVEGTAATERGRELFSKCKHLIDVLCLHLPPALCCSSLCCELISFLMIFSRQRHGRHSL